MSQLDTSLNHGETLHGLFQQGIAGELPLDQLEGALQDFQRDALGLRFELHLGEDVPSVVFCAGSWAIAQVYGSREVATQITILGESAEGPHEVQLSPFHNPSFGIIHPPKS